MKSVLIIQGEGRGHISQAISYCENNPHIKITCVIVSSQRDLPDRFFDFFGIVPVIKMNSLNFEYSNGKVSLSKTILNNIIKLPTFINNVFKVRKRVKHYEPDVVINFYEPLSIFSTQFLDTRKISIANQYLFYTDGWKYPIKNMNYYLIKIWNYITSIGSDEILAPSFIKFPKNKKVRTVDPLIRKDIKTIETKREGYVLVYLIDKTIVKRFVEYAKQNEEQKFELFCDLEFKCDLPGNVNYNNLDLDIFTDKLSKCDKVIATGGFQLICEALYLNKNIEVIPLHYEQEMNSYNLELHNLGKQSDSF
jgi:uncharacterized protein (TIGR00661 family)